MSFSVGTTTTSKTLYLRASNNEDAQIPFTVTFPSGVVAPNKPTISINGTTENTVTIVYGTTSFGTPSTGTVTLYGGTSPNPTTAIATSNTTGDHTFTHIGLTTGTTYYYRARANNGQASSSYSIEVSAIPSTTKPIVLYGSVSNLAKRITTLYGPEQGGATQISRLYGSVNGEARLIHQGFGHIDYRLINTLTAAEYDALDLTAAAYDAEDITAYDYDTNGKRILS